MHESFVNKANKKVATRPTGKHFWQSKVVGMRQLIETSDVSTVTRTIIRK